MHVIQAPDMECNAERDALIAALLDHLNRLPDPKEVFTLLDTVRLLGGISSEEAAMLLHLYWEAN